MEFSFSLPLDLNDFMEDFTTLFSGTSSRGPKRS
jgi:hypothetical protein